MNEGCGGLSTLASNAMGKLYVIRHYGNELGVNSAQIRVIEQADHHSEVTKRWLLSRQTFESEVRCKSSWFERAEGR